MEVMIWVFCMSHTAWLGDGQGMRQERRGSSSKDTLHTAAQKAPSAFTHLCMLQAKLIMGWLSFVNRISPPNDGA